MMRRSCKKVLAFVLILESIPAFGLPPPPMSAPIDKSIHSFANKIKNWGLINAEDKSHIHALDAWKIQEGNPNVIVAVIDTGIDPSHKLLSANIWHNLKEKRPDVFGWNFVANTPNPTDEHGHGTHVAGIIGAIADPSSGVSGVTHRVSIMPVKYYSDSNTGTINLRNTVRAINYAVDHGAQIINYSGGGPEYSKDEYLAIKKAEAKGVLFVAAAGNEHQNTDRVENYYYPSAYRLSNIISVAATDIHNNLLASSNWGKHTVDIGAPGENIFSTLPQGRYGYMSGTSQATAFVSGVAALLLSQDPTLSPQEIKEIIMKTADKLPQLQGRTTAGGRINAFRALTEVLRNKGKFPPKNSNDQNLLAQSQVIETAHEFKELSVKDLKN